MSQVCPKLSMTWDGVEVLVLETKGLASRPQVSQLSRVSGRPKRPKARWDMQSDRKQESPTRREPPRPPKAASTPPS